MKKFYKITLSFLSFCLLITTYSYAQTTTTVSNVPEFNGGLKPNEINTCYAKMEKVCQTASHTGNWMQYKNCIIPKMQQEKTCVQPLALVKTANAIFAMFNTIHILPQIDIVQALTIMADKAETTYMIGKNGDLVDIDAAHPDLKTAKNYASFAKKYPNLTGFAIINPPTIKSLENGGVRLIYQRKLHNLCHACPVIAIADEAYDFASNGKFLAAKALEIKAPPAKVPAPH